MFAALSHGANAADVGVLVASLTDPPRIVYANSWLQNQFGYELSELADRDLRNLLVPSSRVRLEELYRSLKRGEPIPRTIETEAVHKSGEPIPVECRATPISMNGEPALFTFVFDLSDRKRAEQELRDSEARFRRLIESAPDVVMILRDTRILFANRAAAELFEVSDADVLSGQAFEDYLVPDSFEKAQEHFADTMTGESPSRSVEFQTLGGRYVEARSIRVDFEGQSVALTFARDTTERREIQARLLQADRLAAVGMLAAGVAHEINNPLAYVLLNLRYLQRELPKLASQPDRATALLKHVEDAAHGAERVQTIVRDLRIFARADQDETGPVDLVEALESALLIAEHEIRHRAELRRDYGDVAFVNGSSARLEQVFLNVLMNAAQALEPSDGKRHVITITVRMDHGPKPSVVAIISDTGPGIAADLAEQIFEPFFSTKPPGLGTGLGLPICRSIVESFGGTIRLESQVRVGTRCIIELPASDQIPVPPRVESALPSDEPGPRLGRLLIIDDESSVAVMLGRMLENQYDVVTCDNAEAALKELQDPANEFSAVLCDIMMPKMNGMTLYEELKRRSPGLEDRFIFMTGGGSLPEVNEFLSRVERPKIEKPFDLKELENLLAGVALAAASEPPGLARPESTRPKPTN